MKSTIAEKVAVDFAPLIVHEITLVGSRCGRFDVPHFSLPIVIWNLGFYTTVP